MNHSRYLLLAFIWQCSNTPPDTADSGSDASADQDVNEAAVDVTSPADASSDSPDDVASESESAPAPLCDTNKPFGTPVELTELSAISPGLGLPRLTHDELTIYFDAFPAQTDAGWVGSYDVLVATRTSLTSPFTNITTVAAIDTTSNELHPTVTGDNLTLMFASDRDTTGAVLYLATRTSTSAPFGTPTALPPITSDQIEWYPYLSADGLTLYFSSGTGSVHLRRAARASTNSPFVLDTSNIFANVTTFNFEEKAPVVTPDELTIYFSSNLMSSGPLDIYVSTRSSTSTPFGKPSLAVNVNDQYADRPGFISDDGCRLYISSDRTGPSKIYVATKPL